tara:strand:- start:113 stop:331 length:219 start_codon:yes stop_codon:yes gene_type:complete
MKITRMKKGYIIRLSDTEMAVLERTVREGMGAADWEAGGWQRGHLPPAEQRIMTEVQTMKRDWMAITEDRRG